MEKPGRNQPYFRVSSSDQRRYRRPRLVVLSITLLSLLVLSWLALQDDRFVRPGETSLGPTSTATLPTDPVRAVEDGSVTPLEGDEQPSPSAPASFRTAQGAVFFAATVRGRTGLYVYEAGAAQPHRLLDNKWEALDPAVSPDGSQLAYIARQGEAWDLFVADLGTGEARRLTQTAGYEGSPSWSPDGQWLVYEAYDGEDFDLWILPVRAGGDPIQLTSHPAMDTSPDWSPQGRQIVFSSDREGNWELYLANLDSVEGRFVNLTESAQIVEHDPAFSRDGERILFLAWEGGRSTIRVLDLAQPPRDVETVGHGVAAAWSPEGTSIAAAQTRPHATYVYDYPYDRADTPPLDLSVQGTISSLDWAGVGISALQAVISEAPRQRPALYQQVIAEPVANSGRYALVELEGVTAPRPLMSDAADDAFKALREYTMEKAGWDFLANLEYAFVGLNDPLPPGFAYRDWLYTGRAFMISEAVVQAGWVEVFREDIGGETYWRLYVRTRRQDGSQGRPLKGLPWDFSPRFEGDPMAYDRGGAYKSQVPQGYYLDFTQAAEAFGFRRLTALPNWRTYYAGSRYGEFTFREGLTWLEAMLELYPPSAIVTPTPYRTPTSTPTRTPVPTATPWWLRWRTPTATQAPALAPPQTGTPAP